MRWLLLQFSLGLACFLGGFFLTRHEIKLDSDCDILSLRKGLPSSLGEYVDEEEVLLLRRIKEYMEYDGQGSCWTRKRFRRVFFFIVDALRLDFITGSPLHDDDGKRHLLPQMVDLLQNNASQTRFFGFRADPPTVTSQRLKGLTTGSMPTFIDIGSNFDSAKITEDNLVEQFIKYSMRSGSSMQDLNVFMGDDTWDSLYPSQFNISMPFDSFNTRDLNTVDDGIERNLFKVLRDLRRDRTSYGLFVAHFLGVDHIGHTHTAFHPLMKQRLLRMDSLAAKVIKTLPDDALFVMFGDHGMTDDGNHGGATKEETDSGIFFYSKTPFQKDGDSMPPFVKEWHHDTLSMKERRTSDILKDPRIVSQVDLVPTLSLLLGVPVPFSSLGGVIPELFDCGSNHTHGETARKCLDALFINSIQVMQYMRSYDETASIGSLEGLTEALYFTVHEHIEWTKSGRGSFQEIMGHYMEFLNFALEQGRAQFTQFNTWLMLGGLVILLHALIQSVWAEFLPTLGMFSNTQGTGGWSLLMDWSYVQENPSLVYSIFSLGLGVLHALSAFSDNGVKFEGELHLICAHLLVLVLHLLIYAKNGKHDHSMHTLLAMLSIWGSEAAGWIYKRDNSFEERRLVSMDSIYLCGAAFMVITVIEAMGRVIGETHAKTLNEQRKAKQSSYTWWTHIVHIVSLSLIFSMMIVYFFFGRAKTNFDNSIVSMLHLGSFNARLMLPRLCMGISGLHLGWTLFYQGDIYSLFMGMWFLVTLLLLVTGPIGIPCLCCILMYCSQVMALVRITIEMSEVRRKALPLVIPAMTVHLMGLMRHFFFSTAHKLDFGALHLEAGFVGYDTFNFYYAGTLLALNTFGYDIVVLLALKLLPICLPHVTLGIPFQEGDEPVSYNGTNALITAVVYRLLITTCSVIGAFVLRRHLMIWAVFAPKLAFETSIFAVQFVIVWILLPSTNQRVKRKQD